MTFPPLHLLCKLVDTASPTLSICQCPPQCQHVESRARWMSAVTSCCSAAQRKVSPHRPTPGRSWTRCPGCRTTPCKVLQTSWPSEFPFAPPSLVNLTRIAKLRLSNNPTISATCHVPGLNYCPPEGPHPPPPPTSTDPFEGWCWMDGSDSNRVNLWMRVRQHRACGVNPDDYSVFCFLMLNTNSAHLFQTLFFPCWTGSISYGCTAFQFS